MNNLRRLSLSMMLISVLSMAVFAGETSSPPCPPPDPGETSSPPCAVAQMTSDESTAISQLNTNQPANATEVFSAIAIDVLENVLLIF